jgi:fructose transport system permease protein
MAGPRGPEIPAASGSASTTSGASSAEQFVQRTRSPVERVQAFLHRYEVSSSLIVLAITLLAFSLIHGGKFLDAGNMSIVLQQVMFFGTLAIAQSLVILTAGIDLSVGVMALLSMVVMGRLAFNVGMPSWLAIVIGIGVGALCGLINGVLVISFKLSPFIATLGTFAAFGALVLYVSDNKTIGSFELDEKAPLLKATGDSVDLGGFIINPGLLMMLGLFGVIWYAPKWTAWGRHVYAVGADPQAARLVGIRTDRVLLSVYTVAGLVCGIAGWIFIGRNGSVSPQSGLNANLDSITAVVIGGISLFGGRGAVIGALFGAVIVGFLRNGLRLGDLDPLWQEFAVGILILVAVAVDNWIRRVKA